MVKRIILLFLIICSSFYGSTQINYEKDWLKVDSLERKGLYRMALTNVDLIFDQATKNKDHQQVIKSVFYELKYKTYLDEDDYILGIYRLEDLIKKAPSPSKEILHMVTAEVYWGYYNANSWKFAQRTSVASDVKVDDIRTWDLKRIAKKVIFHYEGGRGVHMHLKKDGIICGEPFTQDNTGKPLVIETLSVFGPLL